ncbi:hypothetical protein HWC35_gp133 [Vibrio phage USC-1]|uniref:Uncharacterized protein n=2 Tax=Aphroditevirus USC1 TaxID=2846605 RepID=A0A514A2L4_9CAUD|nr:hypothetical protein HWC35_gp133 [Vibrio phage USC-1]QDH47527.1 hypothetical protein [Vibrio phage USC-1]
MNLFLLVDVNYPLLTQYVNSLYDPDTWVLNSDMLGTHLNDHLHHLNDQHGDPDPILTNLILPDTTLLEMFVPIMKDRTAVMLPTVDGGVCHCPMIMLVNRVHYDHFYRQ